MWERIKVPLIVVGIIILISVIVFLYLLVAGADESRRRDMNKSEGKDGQ